MTMLRAVTFDFWETLVHDSAENIRDQRLLGIGALHRDLGRTPGIILRRVLERHDLLRHFRAISYSDEVGYRKPDAEIFRRTLSELGIDASEAAHVGDNPIADVRGAQSVGMRGVHYATAGRQGAPHADLIVADLGDLVEHLTR